MRRVRLRAEFRSLQAVGPGEQRCRWMDWRGVVAVCVGSRAAPIHRVHEVVPCVTPVAVNVAVRGWTPRNRVLGSGAPMARSKTPDLPSDDDVWQARAVYAAQEPRDLAYRVARDLIERSRRPGASFSTGEGVAILLMSWNSGFYRFRTERVRSLVEDLEALIARHKPALDAWSERTAASYSAGDDGPAVERVYRDLVDVLWPVGTAKALHVLAPSFFPIWDGSIARAFGLTLSPPSVSVASYLRLMDLAHRFAEASTLSDPLKALDEWAYVRYTLGL